MSFKVYAHLFILSICWDLAVLRDEENSLQLVHVIFRHGDKTPEKHGIYPKDPYNDESFWYPFGFGSLTNKGKMQAYNLGRALRERYDDFLGKIYYPDKIYARSTNFDRTKMSLELVLAGLWPPTPIQLWNSLLPWQPVPYEYEPMERDKLLKFPLSYCEKYRQEYLKIRSCKEIQTYIRDNSATIEYINEHTGLNCTSTLDLMVLNFALNSEEQYNLKLSEWTKKVYPDFLEKATALEYDIQTYTDEMLKSGPGYLIKKIIEDSKAKIDNTLIPKGRKIFLYSGHEYNIVQLLASLRLFDRKVPTFASYIILELHKINNQYGFKVFYQNYYENEPKILRIPGCEQFCDYYRFLNIVYKILPRNDTC